MSTLAQHAEVSELLAAVWGAWVLCVGLSLGSFLNVVVARVPDGLSVVHPRSRCPHCAASIAWYDNIPLLSYLLLRARCRKCKSSISAEYPLVETLAGGLALMLWWRHDSPYLFAVDLGIAMLLLALALIDARHFLLPEALSLPLVGLTVLGIPAAQAVDSGLTVIWPVLTLGLIGATSGAALLAFVAVVGTWYARRVGRIGPDEDAMGWGDVILMGAIGARVGSGGVLVVLFLASVQGAILGSLWLWLQDRREPAAASDQNQVDTAGGAGKDAADHDLEDDWQPPPRAIPFGPFLALGCIEWMLFELSLRQSYEKIIDGLVAILG